MQDRHRPARAFTLIELLVVITIIVILLGFLFPAFQGVQDQARKVQAKNDLTQIVTAVNAFYTEYGKYPLPSSASGDSYIHGDGTNTAKGLFDPLRGLDANLNPRQIVFISPPDAKDQTSPKGGMGPTADGQFYDPWGKNPSVPNSGSYRVAIDADYNNTVPNPYTDTAAGPANIRQGVIAWSVGKDGQLGKAGVNTFNNSDDVISWQ